MNRILLRFFFSELFRVESSVDEDSYKAWIIQILALLLTAAWYIPVNLHRRYVELHAGLDPATYRLVYSSDCLSALVLMTLLIALLTVIQWNALFPSRQDTLVLSPLPITRLQFFGAKLGAVTIFVSIAIGSMAFICAVALPGVASGELEQRSLLLRMSAFLVASTGACYFTFWGLLAAQGCLMTLLPVRWFERVSFAVQVVLMVGIICALPLFPYFPGAHLINLNSPWLEWLPPAWYWGWMERIEGSAQWQRLGDRAQWGLAAAFVAASLTYLVSYFQYSRYALESPRRRKGRIIDAVAALGQNFAGPEARGVCEFTLRTLVRCRRQKMVFLLVFGIGVALVVESSTYMALHPIRNARRAAEAMETAVIAAPLTLSFFAMVGLRRAFRVAEELRANWVFQFLEKGPERDAQMEAVLACLLAAGAMPWWLLCAPLQVVVFGTEGMAILAAQAALMFAFARYLLRDWRAIPFTIAQNPGGRHFIQSAVVHILELTGYSFVASSWLWAGLRRPIWFAVLGALLIIILLLLSNLGKNSRHLALDFAERIPEPVEPLRLRAE